MVLTSREWIYPLGPGPICIDLRPVRTTRSYNCNLRYVIPASTKEKRKENAVESGCLHDNFAVLLDNFQNLRFQNCLWIWNQTRISTCETFYTEVINFFYVNILKIFMCICYQAVLKKFTGSQILLKFVFGIFNARPKKIITFLFPVLGFFMVKESFEI